MNDHIHDLLRKFEKCRAVHKLCIPKMALTHLICRVLEEIHDFAKEHVTVNVFMMLLKTVDVAGKIEYFQNRLQTLSMAFHVSLQVTSYQFIVALRGVVHEYTRSLHTEILEPSSENCSRAIISLPQMITVYPPSLS